MRVRDVCRLFDARNIQTYVINGARVVFLNERPHPRGKLAAGVSGSGGDKKTTARDAAGARRSSCRKCSRTLQSDVGWYCSIACKAAVAGKDMEPSEEAAREAEAESGGAEASRRVEKSEKSDKREKSGGRAAAAAAAAAERKKRDLEDVDAERRGSGGFVDNGSPRTPSALGSARGGRGAIGSNGSFGSVRGAKREPDGSGEKKPFFSLGDDTASVGGSGEKDAPSFPLDSPFGKPGKEKRQKRERASPLGFPDLDNEDGLGAGEERARGAGAGFRKKAAPGKEKKEATKPAAVISVSRRKNRPKRSPDA